MSGRRRRDLFVMASALALLPAACGEKGVTPGPDVRVDGAWVRAVAGSDANTAAYMVLRNAGSAPDRLTGAQSAAARATELHRTTIDEAGLARMGKVEALDLLAGGSVVMEPGGFHFMLMGITRTLSEGDTVRLMLDFEATGTVEVTAEVRAF